MPIYHCTNCGFTFKREGVPEQCPDCGKREVRPALSSEKEEFEKRQEKPTSKK